MAQPGKRYPGIPKYTEALYPFLLPFTGNVESDPRLAFLFHWPPDSTQDTVLEPSCPLISRWQTVGTVF